MVRITAIAFIAASGSAFAGPHASSEAGSVLFGGDDSRWKVISTQQSSSFLYVRGTISLSGPSLKDLPIDIDFVNSYEYAIVDVNPYFPPVPSGFILFSDPQLTVTTSSMSSAPPKTSTHFITGLNQQFIDSYNFYGTNSLHHEISISTSELEGGFGAKPAKGETNCAAVTCMESYRLAPMVEVSAYMYNSTVPEVGSLGLYIAGAVTMIPLVATRRRVATKG